MTFYIIDGDHIINAIESNSRERVEEIVRRMTDGERLRVDTNPPLSMLERYRYWRERP